MTTLTDTSHIPEDCPIRPRFAVIDGVTVRYARSERPGAEALLLLSPWPESILAYLPAWEAYSSRYDVLAIDLPGFGGSQRLAGSNGPRAMGDFVAKAIAHFKLDRPHAIGPDVGTSSLLFAAADHPDALASVTVGAGAASYPLQVGGTLKDIIALPSVEPLRQMSIADIVDGVLATLQRYKPAAFVRDDYLKCYDGNRFAESAELVRAYPQELAVLADRLRAIQTPVQIIQGEHDPFVPVSNGEFLAARLPNARLKVLDAGHLAWEDAADEYSRLALEWAQMHRHR